MGLIQCIAWLECKTWELRSIKDQRYDYKVIHWISVDYSGLGCVLMGKGGYVTFYLLCIYRYKFGCLKVANPEKWFPPVPWSMVLKLMLHSLLPAYFWFISRAGSSQNWLYPPVVAFCNFFDLGLVCQILWNVVHSLYRLQSQVCSETRPWNMLTNSSCHPSKIAWICRCCI